MKKWKIIIGILALMILGLLVFLYVGVVRFNYPSEKKFPVRGIDVSHYQGEIDWTKLKEENVRFAFMKATEGGDWKDKKFQRNWQAAQDAGFAVGAYHFFSFCKSGKLQAQNFIETVPYLPESLPPVLDLEFDHRCNKQVPKDGLLKEVRICIGLLQAHYHKSPIIYATSDFYSLYLKGELVESPLWIRGIFSRSDLEDRDWLFWQYGNRGHLQGIEGYVDLNVFQGDEDAFRQLLLPTKRRHQ